MLNFVAELEAVDKTGRSKFSSQFQELPGRCAIPLLSINSFLGSWLTFRVLLLGVKLQKSFNERLVKLSQRREKTLTSQKPESQTYDYHP